MEGYVAAGKWPDWGLNPGSLNTRQVWEKQGDRGCERARDAGRGGWVIGPPS
jgi:hypothetical protein